MTLASGTRLGPYEIVAAIGAGGMGEVYRARDTRLDRAVAIKVLTDAFARDPQRLARFEREAKAVAALSHPNILSIHDIGTDGGQTYVVTELLEGETLRERLGRGALPVRKATDVAVQVARGLAAAHEKGLVHRDLKPENLFLLKDGQVRILDFGLAKVVTPGFGTTETGAVLTDPESVMGTVGYMAPEQVRGQTVDARTDLFALGAVLYEMLSGRRAFHRDTAAETMTAVLREDPAEVAEPYAAIPPALERILRHALEKNPDERFQTARDVAFALEALSGSGTGTSAVLPAAGGRIRWRAVRWGTAVATCLLIAWLGFLVGKGPMPAPTGLPESWEGQLLSGPVAALDPRVSPSGQDVAFAPLIDRQAQVGLLRLASGDWAPLTRDAARGNAQDFAWSYDSTRLYFDRFEAGQPSIFWISPLGGDEKPFLPNALNPQPLPDGSVLVARWDESGQQQLYRFRPEGERLEPLGAFGPLTLASAFAFRTFPDGKSAAFFGRPKGAPKAEAQLYVIALDSGAVRPLAPGVVIPAQSWKFPLAVSPDGAWILFDLPAGDLHRIVAVPSDGSAGVHVLLSLTRVPLGLDVGPDWSIYVDQISQPTEVRWYARPGAPALSQRVPDSASFSVMAIDKDRVLMVVRTGGQKRVMVVQPGKVLAPFVEQAEETDFPSTPLGPDRVALIVGSGPARRVGIVSLSTGRIVGTVDGIDPGAVQSLAASADGKTIFYDTDSVIWAKPVEGGPAVKVRPGHSVSVDPAGRFLVVKVREPERVALFRVPLPVGSGTEGEIRVDGGDWRLYDDWQAPRAISPAGRMLVRAATRTSWFYPVAALDLQTGRLEPVDPALDRDMVGPGWDDAGRIVTQATAFEGSLWRFRPKPRGRD